MCLLEIKLYENNPKNTNLVLSERKALHLIGGIYFLYFFFFPNVIRILH